VQCEQLRVVIGARGLEDPGGDDAGRHGDGAVAEDPDEVASAWPNGARA